MIAKLATLLALAFLRLGAVAAEIPDLEQTRADFANLSAQLPYLVVDAILYDRPHFLFRVEDPKEQAEYFRLLKQATDPKYPKAALLDLLVEADAKVRTLAAVALFDREDPSVLPALARLCDDAAPTFDGHGKLSAEWLRHTGIGPPELKQTVRDIANRMVGFYLERSGFHYGVKHDSEPGFEAYWRARKDRPHCAAWFAVQLARASWGTGPTQKECLERIRAVRARIDQLPDAERGWVLLWLNGEAGSDALATEEELVDACKKLGPQKLLQLLRDKIPSDDPDLQPRANNNWPYKRMQLFVLRHAAALLQRGDSAALLACEEWQRGYAKRGAADPLISAEWAVAAARLDPPRAPRILREAMKRFQGDYDADERATLAIAMWQLAGKREMPYVLDWLYEDPAKPRSYPGPRSTFIEAVGKAHNGQQIIRAIIEDPRMDKLGWQPTDRLVRAVNAWSNAPLVTPDELGKAWHPLGPAGYDFEQAAAEEKYPKETAELRAQLKKWQERLRAIAPNLTQ